MSGSLSQPFCFAFRQRFISEQFIVFFLKGKHEFDADADEALLLGEDFDEEDEEEDERSWKR